MSTYDNIRLALGPVLYYWPKETLLSFYERVAEMPVDIVYLGETVCSKRRALRTGEWIELAERMEAAGKEVVLSTLALLEAESELKTLRRLCDNGRFMVEANDMGAVHLLAGKAPFVVGPGINTYNSRTQRLLARLGMRRWVMPVELSRATLADLQADRPQGLETELFAYGRMPLAISARCFTARAHNLPKDDCQFRCLDYPDGMSLYSREDQSFLALNGVQTQSAQTYNLLGELPDIAALGVDVLRISPHSVHTARAVRAFHECLRSDRSPHEAARSLERYMSDGPCDGYWRGEAGMAAAAGSLQDA
jgi:O2-independent ubiquinone biosynthesis protein UbiV